MKCPFEQVLAMLIGVACASSIARGAVMYPIVTPLPTLGGSFNEPRDLNDARQIVGGSTVSGNAARHAYVYHNGLIVDLQTLGGTHSFARSISANGMITGNSEIVAGDPTRFHGFLSSGVGMSDLGAPSAGANTDAYAVNNSGNVVGDTSFGGPTRGFFYDGSFHDVGSLENNPAHVVVASAINDAGVIAGNSQTDSGSSLFRGTIGALQDLGSIPNGFGTTPTDVNASGQIAGFGQVFVSMGDVSHAFFYDGSAIHDLGALGLEDSQSVALGLNDLGQVVGNSDITPAGGTHAFLYSGGQMLDLNELIDPALGITLTSAGAINNLGDIVAVGRDSANQPHGYLLSLPEPSSSAAVAGTAMLFR